MFDAVIASPCCWQGFAGDTSGLVNGSFMNQVVLYSNLITL